MQGVACVVTRRTASDSSQRLSGRGSRWQGDFIAELLRVRRLRGLRREPKTIGLGDASTSTIGCRNQCPDAPNARVPRGPCEHLSDSRGRGPSAGSRSGDPIPHHSRAPSGVDVLEADRTNQVALVVTDGEVIVTLRLVLRTASPYPFGGVLGGVRWLVPHHPFGEFRPRAVDRRIDGGDVLET